MRNYNLATIKVIAAISVVLIHSTYFIYADGEASLVNYYWYRPLLNFAVPFFFSASGYLLSFKKLEYFKLYLKRILIMFVLYTFLYYGFDGIRTVGSQLVQGNGVAESIFSFLSLRNIYDFTSGTIGHSHLWYLWALWLGCGVLYFALKRGIDSKRIMLISVLFYIVISLLRELPVVEEVVKEGGMFKALAFLSVGYFAGKQSSQTSRPLIKSLVVLLVYAIFYQVTGVSSTVDLILIISTWYLMIFISNNPGSPNKIASLDKYSTDIYLNHMFIITAYSVIIGIIPAFLINNILPRVVVLTIFSVGISIIMSKPLKKIYLEPLSKIF